MHTQCTQCTQCTHSAHSAHCAHAVHSRCTAQGVCAWCTLFSGAVRMVVRHGAHGAVLWFGAVRCCAGQFLGCSTVQCVACTVRSRGGCGCDTVVSGGPAVHFCDGLRLFASVHTTAAVHGVLSATSPRDSWRWIVQPIRTHTINCWEFMAVVFLPPLGSSADRNCR